VECLYGDITDPAATLAACAGMDAVIHTAAKAGIWGTEAEFHAANVIGSQNVLDACRANGVPILVHTSTPSVVYTGGHLSGVDETQALVRTCPCFYPLTKAEAERRVLAANSPALHTIALRPHLLWGGGEPHLVPRILQQARAGKLRIVGNGKNRVDLTHIENAVQAHLCALDALCGRGPHPVEVVSGRAYFISDGSPVVLWDWINALLEHMSLPPITRQISPSAAFLLGGISELFWRLFRLHGEPPLTRFVARELSCDHWFSISAARHFLGYAPAFFSPESEYTKGTPKKNLHV
jgi:nucleoside-diphosphate-sugar epimerase